MRNHKSLPFFFLFRSGHHLFPSTKILINGWEGRVCVAIRGGRREKARNNWNYCSGCFICDSLKWKQFKWSWSLCKEVIYLTMFWMCEWFMLIVSILNKSIVEETFINLKPRGKGCPTKDIWYSLETLEYIQQTNSFIWLLLFR